MWANGKDTDDWFRHFLISDTTTREVDARVQVQVSRKVAITAVTKPVMPCRADRTAGGHEDGMAMNE